MIALYLVIFLQLADIISTIIALKGGAHEANPIMAGLMRKIGTIPALLVLKGAFIGLLVYFAPQLAAELLYAIAAGYAWIVGKNILVIRKS